MARRDTIGTSTILTFALILAGIWVVAVGSNTVGIVQSAMAQTQSAGQTAFSGILGLLVMGVFLFLAVVLYGELSETETDRAPKPWPPE